jgi:hypothetical protein
MVESKSKLHGTDKEYRSYLLKNFVFNRDVPLPVDLLLINVKYVHDRPWYKARDACLQLGLPIKNLSGVLHRFVSTENRLILPTSPGKAWYLSLNGIIELGFQGNTLACLLYRELLWLNVKEELK